MAVVFDAATLVEVRMLCRIVCEAEELSSISVRRDEKARVSFSRLTTLTSPWQSMLNKLFVEKEAGSDEYAVNLRFRPKNKGDMKVPPGDYQCY